MGQSLHLAVKAIVFSSGCGLFCLEIQAVALTCTNDDLCACIYDICILFLQIHAFEYSTSCQVLSNINIEDLNAKMFSKSVCVFKLTLFCLSLFLYELQLNLYFCIFPLLSMLGI